LSWLGGAGLRSARDASTGIPAQKWTIKSAAPITA
jgi:hypothetical protein